MKEGASTSKRVRPSRWLKAQVLTAQQHQCLGCACRLDAVEFDHVIPLALGGLNSMDNWAALCPTCHRTKTRGDLKRIAKAKRQRRYHETGKSRAPSTFRPIGKARAPFDRSTKRHLNGVVTPRVAASESLGDALEATGGDECGEER